MFTWFIESSGQIEGPYSTDVVKARIKEGQLMASDMIWGRIMEEWRPVSWWVTSLDEMLEKEKRLARPEVWHYGIEGQTYGPFNWETLISRLRVVLSQAPNRLPQILIWTQGIKEWTNIIEFHNILEALGVNKRQHPRAAISGRTVIRAAGRTYVAPLRTISEGGFGTDTIGGISSGENVTVEIQSDALSEVIHARAVVRYVTSQSAGFKFSNINVESTGMIVQYVRRASPDSRGFSNAA